MVSHWVQVWALLSPEGQRDAIASGCTWLGCSGYLVPGWLPIVEGYVNV
jgi:hypothetical protein